MKITLYQAQADKQRAILLCTDEDGCIDMEKFAAIEGTFQDRCVATVAVCKTLAHSVTALKAQRDAVKAEYDQQIKMVEGNMQRLEDNLHVAMSGTGTSVIKSDDGMLQAKLYLARDVSVELDEGATFPASLCSLPKPPEPSKTLIRAAIEAGEAVAGARIVRADRLTIK